MLLNTTLCVFPDSATLVEEAAGIFIRSAGEAIAARGRFSVALAGGNTPRALYTRLAAPEHASHIPWEATHFFWGDERCLPPDHAESNYRMTVETLLSRVPFPVQNIHRVAGELSPPKAAARYESDLRDFFGAEPIFDLVLLGMGDDGHTASLFPGSTALAESARWAVDVEHTIPPPPLVARVTLTLQVFNAARRVVFLVTGAVKALRLAEIRRGDDFPAARIRPVRGELLWLVDETAASRLG